MINFCVTRIEGCCDIINGEDETAIEESDCKVADTITNNMIANDLMAKSVGRALIDDEGYDWDIIQGTTSLYENVEPKTIAESTDKHHGTIRTKVSKFGIRIERVKGGMSARSVFELKRPKI